MNGNVVSEFTLGKTKIRICDDYCHNKTKAEVDEILDRVSAMAFRALNAGYQNENKVLCETIRPSHR